MVDNGTPKRRDSFHQLCQYWEVSDAERPTYRDLYDHQKDGVYNYPGIVFISDSTLVENPRGDIRYGKFSLKGNEISAIFDDGAKAIYIIDEKQPGEMMIRREQTEQSTVLHLKSSNVFYETAEVNPYAKKNSLWRMKPAAPQNEAELRLKLKDCVKFYRYFFQGHVQSKSDEIDFAGLPTCFKWYRGGIFVHSEKKLDQKWIDCFYSKDQAMIARQKMQDILQKKYDWDTTQKNWLKQLIPVLTQVEAQL
ncbi:MAG: hypothetical protein ABIR19_09290 [Ginsengibacter sp.]